MSAELRDSPTFAEVAEVVGVPTSQIIAAYSASGGNTVVVIFNPEPLPADDPDGVDTTAWVAKMGRDRDDILRLLSPVEPSPFSVHDVCASFVRMLP